MYVLNYIIDVFFKGELMKKIKLRIANITFYITMSSIDDKLNNAIIPKLKIRI